MSGPDANSAGQLEPLEVSAWPESISRLRSDFAGALNIYRIMAHHPDLLTAWENIRNHVVRGNALSPRLQEIVILRAGFRWRSGYEWAHHVHRGKAAGLADAEIAAAGSDGPTETLTDPVLTALIEAVDQLLRNGRLDQPLRGNLLTALGPEGILDLCATVGMYTTLAFIANSFNPPLDDGIPAVPLPSGVKP